MLIDTFSNRLNIALKNNDMRPIDLANKTNIDRSSISRYLSGDWKASQKRLSLLAMALNTNEAWLMGYDVSPEPNTSHITYSDYKLISNNSNKLSLKEKKDQMIKYMDKNKIDFLSSIPVYTKLNDKNFSLSDDFIDEYLIVDTSLYNIKNSDELFYIKLFDNSLNNKYQKGDYLLMKKTSELIKDSISLLIFENKILIRKLSCQKDIILLESLSNDNNYKTLACTKDKIKILGILIGYTGYKQ